MADAITNEAIDRVLALAPAQILKVGDYEYIDKDRLTMLFQPPVLKALSISTLSSFAALIDAGFERFEKGSVIVHVESFDQVDLIHAHSDKWGRRQSYLTAKALKPERVFKFNEFIDQETFNIALQSMFVPDEAVEDVLKVTGNLAAKAEVRQQDDGFTQEVTAKAGVVRVENLTVRPRVTLKPFRTFSEIEQPPSDYILRVKVQEGAGNMCALFEADAGAWKNTAMDSIAGWLRNKLKGSSVEGVGDIPIVS